MGLVQKIFYYHMPSAWMFLTGGLVCGVASARYPGDGRSAARPAGAGRAPS